MKKPETGVWKGDTKDGAPAHEWVMPGVLPMEVAINQAVLQSQS